MSNRPTQLKDKLLKPTLDTLTKFPTQLKWHEDTFIKPRDKFIEDTRKIIDKQAKEFGLTGSGVKGLEELMFALAMIRQPNGEEFLTDYMKCMRWYHLVKKIPPTTTEEATRFFDKLYLLFDLASDDEILERLKIDKGGVLAYIDEVFPNQLDIILHMESYPVYRTADKYVNYCAKNLFVAMASQKNDDECDLDLSTSEQIRVVFKLFSSFKYNYYHLEDTEESKPATTNLKKLEQFRNRAVPKEFKTQARSK